MLATAADSQACARHGCPVNRTVKVSIVLLRQGVSSAFEVSVPVSIDGSKTSKTACADWFSDTLTPWVELAVSIPEHPAQPILSRGRSPA